jgi:hypothetical protein
MSFGRKTAYREPMGTISWARELAGRLLGDDLRRFSHVRAVAERAGALGEVLFAGDASALEAAVMAAWLHDIGYAPELAVSGCHHLDGAAFLRGLGEERLAGLVAYHSSGAAEAELRGLSSELACFAHEESLVTDLLTCCDLTSGPDGRPVALDDRLREVEDRYGATHVVSCARQAGPSPVPELRARLPSAEPSVIAWCSWPPARCSPLGTSAKVTPSRSRKS